VNKLVLGLALLAAVAALAVRPDAAPAAVRRSSAPGTGVEGPSAAGPVAQAAARPLAAPPVPARAAGTGTPSSATVEEDVDPTPRLVEVLTRLLALSPEQRIRVDEILVDRARQVREYEQEVSRRGWAQPREFESRMGGILDLAQRRLLAVLSSAQGAELIRALAAGIPEDHLSIEIPRHVVTLR
jgi:hypothetical protein